ncbi:MAG TPA: hypothetical protein VLW50_05575 [Streptosporangiaceae bacterium]|nr:hypothetical protein [Streptosporangiaceae bacterium]
MCQSQATDPDTGQVQPKAPDAATWLSIWLTCPLAVGAGAQRGAREAMGKAPRPLLVAVEVSWRW